MERSRKTKIMATLGPASDDPEVIAALFRAGADLFRLNFSHGEVEDSRRRVEIVRAVEAEAGRPVGILLDLQGPKFRIGAFADGGVEVADGARLRLDLEERPGDARRVCFPHPEVLAALAPGALLLVDDGRIRLQVVECGADYAEAEVAVGGALSDRKGVNVPGVFLPLSAMSDKDRRDVATGLELGVDWIALSFVQRGTDADELRTLVGGQCRIMAKIEKPAALEDSASIVDAFDAVMIARGDLGVELPPERVPSAQKRLVRACRKLGKPVVVATQMLESMVRSPVPTRAEASDVATAVYEGADVVMLSAETAVGRYPVESVTFMSRIVEQIEGDEYYREGLERERTRPEPTVADAICQALRSTARVLSAPAVVAYTASGFSGLRAAHERPHVPILALTPSRATARQLALAWGVYPVVVPDVANEEEMAEVACRAALDEGAARPGDRIVIAAGVPFGAAGTTNLIRVVEVPRAEAAGAADAADAAAAGRAEDAAKR